jgi:hypothetical protein
MASRSRYALHEETNGKEESRIKRGARLIGVHVGVEYGI